MAIIGRKLATLVLLVGILSVAMGGFFIYEGVAKGNLITASMELEKVKYASADGSIDGLIDNPKEAAVMAGVLREHRFQSYGYYAELKKDDPKRDQILKAMTMENSLNLAQMGYGLTDVVKANGVFMIIVGLTFITGAASAFRAGTRTS